MAAPLASVPDLEDSMGRALSSTERSKATGALRYASTIVRAFAPWVDTLAVKPDAVVDVVTSVAERRLTARRDGVTGRTVGAVSVQYGRGESPTLTPDERLILARALGVNGNLSVSLVRPDPVL